MNVIIADRDRKIAALSKDIAERDRRIAELERKSGLDSKNISLWDSETKYPTH